MDYSLLVGVHPTSNQLIVGIVDFIGSFTLYKQIEAKGKTILGGTAENVTVLHPLRYRDRFKKAIDQYFLVVPGVFVLL